MTLEFLDNISGNQKYTNVISDQLIRLYDFDETEVNKLLLEAVDAAVNNYHKHLK